MLIFSIAPVWAQMMSLKPYGISPNDADQDTEDVFDRPYNGLLNVGIETKIYFKGQLKGSSLNAPIWTIYGPIGANDVISESVRIDDSTQIAAFIPDSIGTYTIIFQDGSYSASIIINAGMYLGIEEGGCGLCHSSQKNDWQETGHATFFELALNGLISSHYGSQCISCHTTGYDENANNNGFDDREFILPDTLYMGQWDTLLLQYPDAMKLAGIQCESCHGPGDAHKSGNISDSKIALDYHIDVCAVCHDSGIYHIYPEQWKFSPHTISSPTFSIDRIGCQNCHTGEGFVQSLKGESVIEDPYEPISCAVCHDPHSNENEHYLRTVEASLANGEIITDGGKGQLCMNCHRSRQDAIIYVEEYLSHLSLNFGPHYSPQADILTASNVPTFGETLPSTPHLAACENSCIDCHMATVPYVDDIPLVGSHTFAVTDTTGVDNVAICEKCHESFGVSFKDMKYYIANNADQDGDGIEEGLQFEVQGLLDTLASLLPKNSQNEVEINDSSVTLVEAEAAYNYFLVKEDGSFGIHNPAFTVSLLKESIWNLIYAERITIPTILSSPSGAKVGESINFTGGSSTSSLGSDIDYRFNFGDGFISDWGDSIQSHIYMTIGIYTVKAQARSELDTAIVSNWSLGKTITLSGHVINISVNGLGNVIKEPDKTEYNHDETVKLTAAAESGYSFDHWEGALTGNNNPDSVRMSGDQTIIVQFIELVEMVTVPNIFSGPTESEVGKSVLLRCGGSMSSLGNDIDYRFDFGDGFISDWGDSIQSHLYLTVGMYTVKAQGRDQSDTTVVSNWSSGQTITLSGHSLAIIVNGSGSVLADPEKSEYNHKDKVILTAVPSSNYQFDHWEGDLSGESNPDSVIMDSDIAITAIFNELLETARVLPNPFTPNDDGFNDYVAFQYPEMEVQNPVVRIFNLRGRKVTEFNHFSGNECRWDGKDKDGKTLEPGVYIYIFELDNKVVSSGTITLIK